MSKSRLPRYVVLHKKRGETPLELLNSWKVTHSEFQETPMAYAGRLDPMAEGKMLVLLGDECKKQSLYTKLDKEYEIEVLLDMKTDTGDLLGIPEYQGRTSVPDLASKVSANTKDFAQKLACVLSAELGPHSRKYPTYSSKTVNGKPLFLYSLEGTLGTITIPEHIETVYKISKVSVSQFSTAELQQKIEDALTLVPRSDEPSKVLGADFRQDEVREKWRELFSKVPAQEFTILKLRVVCGSGTYMRTLAERTGASFGSAGLAFSINRTKIGKYRQFGPFGFWTKQM